MMMHRVMKGVLQMSGILLVSAVAQAGEVVVLEGGHEAAGLSGLRLTSDVGDLRVEAADTERVSWRVEASSEGGGFLFWYSSGMSEEELGAIRVQARAAEDGLLHLAAEVPEAHEDENLVLDWRVTVPRHFRLVLDTDVGDVSASGVSGGISVRSDVGDVRLEPAGGDLDVRSDVGDVDIIYPRARLGRLDLASDVGDIEVRVDGKRVEPEREEYGPGGELSADYGAGTRIHVRTDVGDIELDTVAD